ncbi:MAG: LysR family transcriptional regulator [Devosia sp.]|nr:LysR family transcriptional regulator [Devosia sp.]
MKRDDLYDLAAFEVVAKHASFTRAAAELDMSQSALSHAIKMLEERLGVRLLARTTRSVSVTEAGETLLRSLRPALDDIATGVDALGAMRGKAAGTIRLTATKHAISSVVMPLLPKFLAEYPDVQLQMLVDDSFIDIVAMRIDAGIRFGDIVEKDMIAVRIGPDVPLAVVGAPSYFEKYGHPGTPRELSLHRCINYRHLRTSGVFGWEFVEDGRPLQVRVEGPLTFSNSELLLEAALAGHGLAYVYENEVLGHVAAGRLERTLAKWCPNFPGYYLYHPSRRQVPPALAALVAALKYRP